MVDKNECLSVVPSLEVITYFQNYWHIFRFLQNESKWALFFLFYTNIIRFGIAQYILSVEKVVLLLLVQKKNLSHID